MSKNKGKTGDKTSGAKTWNTKYGTRRVREDAPTLDEAIAAAQGLSDELDEQVEIAASLMGLPRDEVRTELLKKAPVRQDTVKSVVFAGPASAPRVIAVERKISRRVPRAAGSAGAVDRAGRVSLNPRNAWTASAR